MVYQYTNTTKILASFLTHAIKPLAHLESQSNLKDFDCSSQLNGNNKSQHSQHPKECDPNSNSTFTKSIFPWMKESTRQICKKNNRDKPVKVYGCAQLVELEAFHLNRFMCQLRRVEMPNQINLKERQIKIWFQNLRSSPEALTSLGYINAMGDDDVDYDAVSPPSLKLQYLQQKYYVSAPVYSNSMKTKQKKTNTTPEYAPCSMQDKDSNINLHCDPNTSYLLGHNYSQERIKHALKLTHYLMESKLQVVLLNFFVVAQRHITRNIQMHAAPAGY
uniref:Homeobox domain-containing protein n=1 Tax=Oncorhynchus mykiss TaxID=8022 RepID=A0A8C7SCF6_ONCMY